MLDKATKYIRIECVAYVSVDTYRIDIEEFFENVLISFEDIPHPIFNQGWT